MSFSATRKPPYSATIHFPGLLTYTYSSYFSLYERKTNARMWALVAAQWFRNGHSRRQL